LQALKYASDLLLHWRMCRDYVKKVAVYKDRVAVQLPSRVVLYKLDSSADDMDMQYRSAAKMNQKMECNLLVVASNHILLCQVGCVSGWQERGGQHAAARSVECGDWTVTCRSSHHVSWYEPLPWFQHKAMYADDQLAATLQLHSPCPA
jgi:ferredoxin-like protein FixX